jgi:hypothetical protein
MPGYTILIMRRNATDRRPITLNVAGWFLWSALFLAIALPIGGFLVSVGYVAPAWLKLNVQSMQHQVEEAEKIKSSQAEVQGEMERLRGQLDEERKLRAEAETKLTMAETARAEATTKLTDLEVEAVTLKRSVATYEQMLKPKLARELVQCVNFEVAQTKPGTVSYGVSFAKLTKSEALPKLNVRIRVVAGDNAVALESSSSGKTVTVPLEKDLRVKGEMAVSLPADVTRLIDVKALDESGKPVGYCWKTF